MLKQKVVFIIETAVMSLQSIFSMPDMSRLHNGKILLVEQVSYPYLNFPLNLSVLSVMYLPYN